MKSKPLYHTSNLQEGNAVVSCIPANITLSKVTVVANVQQSFFTLVSV